MIYIIGSITSKITQGPIDVSIGTIVGLVWGFFLIFVPASPWAVIYNSKTEDRKIKKSEVSFLYGVCIIIIIVLIVKVITRSSLMTCLDYKNIICLLLKSTNF